MKTTKFAMPPLVLLSGLLALGSVMAGPPDHDPMWRAGPPSPEQHLARLSQELDLNQEQSQQMLRVLQDAQADHDALRARMHEQFQPELCALRQDTQAGILEILTPEQGELFLELQEQNQSRAGQARQRRFSSADCEGFGG